MKYKICFQLIIMMSICQLACSQSAEKFTGTFINKELHLKLEVKKSNNQYSGFFQLLNQQYPFKGLNENNKLVADYDYEGREIPFSLYIKSGTYFLNSEGYDIEMQRTPAPPETVSSGNKKEQQAPNINSPMATTNGKRMTDPYGGYSFQIPAGWISKEEQGSFNLSIPGEAASFSVSPHHYKSKQEIINQLQEIVDPSSDTHLRPTITENNANDVFVRLEGRANGKPVLVEIISVVSLYGGGVSFTYGVQPDKNFDKYNSLLKAMAASVHFIKPQISTAAIEWTNRLSGRQLVYLNTSGGGSQRITINLYQDGTFSHSNNISYLSGGSSELSYAGKSADKGNWKIQSRNSQSVLVLFAEDGSTREYVLSPRSANGELNLNDRRYFITSLNQ